MWDDSRVRSGAPGLRSITDVDFDLHQTLYRDDRVPLGCVPRLEDGKGTYAYTTSVACCGA